MMAPGGLDMKGTSIKVNPKILEWARRKAHLSQTALARMVGVPVQEYGEWESGNSYPTKKELFRIALALRCPITVFLCLGVFNG